METSIFRFLFFSSKVQKVKYLPYFFVFSFFSESSYGKYLQVLWKRNFNPTTWRTSRTTSRWCWTQKVWATQSFIKKQNDRKGRYTLVHFSEKCKKAKNEVTETEKRHFWLIYLKTFNKSTFLGPVTSISNFFLDFSKKNL